MITVKAKFPNGKFLMSTVFVTFEEINAYYLNRWFNLGDAEGDDMQKCIEVEFVSEKTDDKYPLNEEGIKA